MPKKEWWVDLGNGLQIFVCRDTDLDRFAVVLVEEATNRNIARYDNAHGYVHLDILDRDGNLIKKIKHSSLNRDEAIAYATNDFKKNWKNYL